MSIYVLYLSPSESTGHDVKSSTITLDHVPYYVAARDARRLIKLVEDKETDELPGAHILAPDGSELD